MIKLIQVSLDSCIKKILFQKLKNEKAIFPGSFDPITLGHFDIIERGSKLFDELIIAIGINADKRYMFSLEQRKKFILEAFKDNPKIKVVTYKGLNC